MDAKMTEAGAKMMAAPAAKAGGVNAATPVAAKAGGLALTSGKLLAATKATVATPMFGVVALSSIIVFQWWKGKRDARQFSSSEK
ncbi:hypothetical protein GMJAKD_04525 [Candidatus Electrothrix aarhusensis]